MCSKFKFWTPPGLDPRYIKQIIPAEKPNSSVSFQRPLGLTPIQYSFWDSRLETPQPTTEDPAATIQLAQQSKPRSSESTQWP